MNDYPSNFDRFIGLIQLLDFQMNIEQTSNDEILQELQNQDNTYLSTIIKQNKDIIVQNEIIIKQNEEILKKLDK